MEREKRRNRPYCYDITKKDHDHSYFFDGMLFSEVFTQEKRIGQAAAEKYKYLFKRSSSINPA